MVGRVPRRVVRDIDEVAAIVAAMPASCVVLFDVDNTLVHQGAPSDEVGRLVDDAIDRFEAIPAVTRVIVLTNGPQRGAPRMISRGNKPWTSKRRLGVRASGGDVYVVGDQVLTDGVLAWRLGAAFLQLVIDDMDEDTQQARMRRWGHWVAPLLFRNAKGDGS